MALTFSIIIPSYNYAHTLERAVSSAISQSGDDFEVIVVNDGSTDNTHELCCKLVSEYGGGLTYFRKENGGPSSARNFGIENSSGEYLIFLDADDELLPDALIYFRKAYGEGRAYGLIFGSHIAIEHEEKNFNMKKKKLHLARMPSSNREQCFEAYINKNISICNGAAAIRRSSFNNIRYNEELAHAEDVPVFGLILAGYDCKDFPEPVVNIYKHSTSIRHDNSRAEKAGIQVVSELFEHSMLPASCQKYKKVFLVRRCLSLFRTLYRAKNFEVAAYYFRMAISEGGWYLIRPKIWARYFYTLMKKYIVLDSDGEGLK